MPFKLKKELPYLAFTIQALEAYTLFTILPLFCF